MVGKILSIVAVLAFYTALAGFNTQNAIVDPNQILSGGPPRDGIPALLKPKLVRADDVDYLEEDDQVIGVVVNGKARAYPIKILNWHEAVNDTLNGQPLLVTF
jgi:hypothetical protein